MIWIDGYFGMNLKRRLALAYYRAKGGFPAKIAGERYRLVPENRKFWRKVADKQWEPHTFIVLDRYLHPDSVYLDIGAWIGPTVLFAARRCKTVYCVEPDPVAYQRLLANLHINGIGNVLPFHGALGARNEVVQIASEGGFGDSETRIRAQGAPEGDGVPVLALDIASLVAWWGIERIDLLKMDIEGAEFDLVPSLINFLPRIKPPIYLSLHAPLFPQSERRDKLAAVVELAGHYAFCYDKRLNQISPDEVLGESFAEKFNTVLLTDAALS